MLLRVSCVAILIAVACFQFSSAETKLMDKLKENAEMTQQTETTDLKERNKRALYYQNDLISNKERQIRKAFPLGPIGGIGLGGGLGGLGGIGGIGYGLYDYAYGLPFYDYLAYDYYPLYGGLYDYGLLGGGITDSLPARAAAAPAIAGSNAKAVQTVVNPALQAAVEYDDDDDLTMLNARYAAHNAAPIQQQHGSRPLAAQIQPSQWSGYAQQQQFAIPQQYGQQKFAHQQAIAPQAIIASPQAQQYAPSQRSALNAIRAASSKSAKNN